MKANKLGLIALCAMMLASCGAQKSESVTPTKTEETPSSEPAKELTRVEKIVAEAETLSREELFKKDRETYEKNWDDIRVFIEYGMIILGNVEEPVRRELAAPEMNTHIVYVKDLEQAAAAAKQLAEEGVDGIELCGWFDLERTKSVIAAVESVSKKIPVGSNGLS